MSASGVSVGAASRRRVLWVDDDLREVSVERAEAGFRAMDMDLEVCADSLIAKDKLGREVYDALIVDLLMPGLNGLDLLSLVANSTMRTKSFVFSGFLDARELADSEFLREHCVTAFDKHEVPPDELPARIDAAFRKVPAVEEPVIGDAAGLIADEAEKTSILDYTFDHFASLRQGDRYLIKRMAADALSDVITKEFDAGAVWCLYLGKGRAPLSVRDYSLIPDDKEIRGHCKKFDVPIYQFFRDVEVDDLVWDKNCSTSCARYPLIGLKAVKGKAERAVHFDTGSAMSFMDRDVLASDFGVVFDDADDIEDVRVNGDDLRVVRKKCSFYLIDHKDGRRRVAFHVMVPEQWVGTWLAKRFCHEGCARSAGVTQSTSLSAEGYREVLLEGKAGHICRYRWGLVGRNSLLEGKIVLVLDGKAQLLRAVASADEIDAEVPE